MAIQLSLFNLEEIANNPNAYMDWNEDGEIDESDVLVCCCINKLMIVKIMEVDLSTVLFLLKIVKK